MEMTLARHWYSTRSIAGQLAIDGVEECFTLERPFDDLKHPCIKAGRYWTTLYDSPRLGRKVLLLHDVPGRTMIELHNANFPWELEGCIAVGLSRADDRVEHSVVALDAIIAKVAAAGGGAWITITDEQWVSTTP